MSKGKKKEEKRRKTRRRTIVVVLLLVLLEYLLLSIRMSLLLASMLNSLNRSNTLAIIHTWICFCVLMYFGDDVVLPIVIDSLKASNMSLRKTDRTNVRLMCFWQIA